MKKNILYGGVCGLIVGLVIGFYIANTINRREISQQQNAQQNTINPSFPQQKTQAADIKEPQTPQGKPLPEVSEKLDRAKNEPNNFDAQIQAGNMYLQIRGLDKANEFFDKAEQLNPKEYENIVKLGNAYFDIGKFEKAEKWYVQALNTKPDDINVRTDLGITFVEREKPDFDRAIKEFQTGLQIKPNYEPTLYNLAIAFFKKGDANKAANVLSQLEETNPQSELVPKLRQLLSQK